MKRLVDAGQHIRTRVNGSEMFENCFKSRQDDWHQLCVAMDTFGDSATALMNFEEYGLGSTEGERYLRLYGAFQAIILQQDAIMALYRLFVGKAPPTAQNTGWEECRLLRNQAFGHPTDFNPRKHRKGRKSWIFLSRPSISARGFDFVIREEGQRDPIIKHVDFFDAYERYKKEALELTGTIKSILPSG